MASVFTVGASAPRRAAPSALKERLAAPAPPASAVAARLASKLTVAEKARAEQDAEARRRATSAAERRARAAARIASELRHVAQRTERRHEAAAERVQSVKRMTVFKAADATQRLKAASFRQMGDAAARREAVLAAEEAGAARARQRLEERKQRASAASQRRAAVVARAHASAAAKAAATAAELRLKQDHATAARLTLLGLMMGRNVAHSIHALAVADNAELYGEQLRQYAAQRLDAGLKLANVRRELHIHEVRAKAKAVADRARERAAAAAEAAELHMSLAGRTLEDKLNRAEKQRHLIQRNAMGPGDKLSICGNFVVDAAGAWREAGAMSAATAAASEDVVREGELQEGCGDASEEWELVPNAGLVPAGAYA